MKPIERPLSEVDPEVYAAIQHETERQHSQLERIASENFTSEAVLEATGSVLTNKYAEGYPGKRYHGGCEFTDFVENLARDGAKKLFGAEYAKVQPRSCSQATQAAYAAVLTPGDTIMGLNLAHGGHLMHGHQLDFFDVNKPFNTSGIAEMREVGTLMAEVPQNIAKPDAIRDVRQKVTALTARFPLYDWKLEKTPV